MAENNENKRKDLNRALEEIQRTLFHVKCKNQLSDSVVNYFTMAIGFFMFGCVNAEIFKSETTNFLFWNIMIAGLAQLFLGIYDWYKGKSLSILINFSYGFLFISWFMKNNYLEKNMINQNEKYEGALYVIWCALTLIILIGVKNKGVIYSLDYLALAAGFIFIFVDKYADQKWSRKTYGYIFIVSGGFFWITGLLRFINSSILGRKLDLVKE